MKDAITIGDHYQLIERIGEGMTGPVFKGQDIRSGRSIAVKVLKPEIAINQPVLLERFKREDEALQRLNHPNIIRRIDFIEQEQVSYLVMEYIEGGSLRDLLDNDEPIPLQRILEISLDIADALTRSHRLQIIHRDLKPENVLIARDGTPRLSDFGLAHFITRITLSDADTLVGTWSYIPPEIFLGEEADERADIWSFGVMLFEMLTKEVPYDADTPAELVNKVLAEPSPDLHAYRADLPSDLYKLIESMLAKNKEDRISSSRVIGAALEAIYHGQDIELIATRRAPDTDALQENLPKRITTFIGRENQVSEIMQILQSPECRLLTLTGPGGVGKTRMAIEIASHVRDNFSDGLAFVDLAPIAEPGQVVNRIARVLGVKEAPSQALIDNLKLELQQKDFLLIMDNYEQVIETAPIISDLLSACANLKVLVTSRELLRIYGEQEYPIPPMMLPDPEHQTTIAALTTYESVALFYQRAQAANPQFRMTRENARDIAEICVRLDGLPLAIELAAARVKLYSPGYLLDQLSDSLGLLSEGARDISARHQTIRGAIDWSYNLLTEFEQTLFRRLAIFQGGRTLEAVDYVCCFDLELNALNGLESLFSKNLLQIEQGLAGEPRFIFLETIHQYARIQLEDSGELHNIYLRHADYYLELVETAEPKLQGPHQEKWASILRSEYDNLNVSMAWSLKKGDHVKGMRLVAALTEFWYYDGPITEAQKWIAKALSRVDEQHPAIHARLLNGAGMMAFANGDHINGREWNEKALELAKSHDDKDNWGWALLWLSAHLTTDPDQYSQGIEYCQTAVGLFSETGNSTGLAWVNNQLGEFSRLTEDYDAARDAYKSVLKICRESGNTRRASIALVNLGYVAHHQEDNVQAERYILEGLALMHELRLMYHAAISLSILAGPVAALGQAIKATRLLGASESAFETLSASVQPADQVEFDRYIENIKTQINQLQFEIAWEEGQLMSLDNAILYALSESK